VFKGTGNHMLTRRLRRQSDRLLGSIPPNGAMGVRARGLDIKAGAAKLAAVIVRPWQKPSPGVDRTGAGPTRVPTMAFVNGSLTIRWQR
jgi:hypothetical protein